MLLFCGGFLFLCLIISGLTAGDFCALWGAFFSVTFFAERK